MPRLPCEGLVHIGPQTFDVDVQLILAAGVQGIDGEADEPRGHRPADDAVQPLVRLPSGLEIARRPRRFEHRALDAGDGLGRYQQKMRPALAVREHGITRAGSAVEMHFHAGSGAVLVAPMGETLILHDLAQRIAVRARARRCEERRRRGTRSKGQSQRRLRNARLTESRYVGSPSGRVRNARDTGMRTSRRPPAGEPEMSKVPPSARTRWRMEAST